ncbi:MAG: hypothetical protein RBS16_09955, partial [Candidatus Cloacimonadales bacterium]|nr:hypothetical protein [Candidatus Cloacimonadales bacterium]
DFGDVLENQFDFAYEFSDLATQKGIESNIAIVHIDGNDMGKLFSKCNDLSAYQELSKKVNNANVDAFRNMLVFAVDKILRKDWKYYKKYLTKSKNGRKCLPIRPIFIGGDDVTFVCEGRMGIPLAIEFIEQIDKLSEKKYNCCAGIAVVNEKYPFYQGVQMAQSLCSQAKKKRIKEQDDDKAYIDFQLINSSTCDPLEEIRKQYKREGKDLYEKPYNLEELKEQLKHAELLRKWPRSKVKELRDVIFKNKEAIDAFELQIQARGDLEYPLLEDDKKLYPVSHKYPDIIELMELIPDGGK